MFDFYCFPFFKFALQSSLFVCLSYQYFSFSLCIFCHICVICNPIYPPFLLMCDSIISLFVCSLFCICSFLLNFCQLYIYISYSFPFFVSLQFNDRPLCVSSDRDKSRLPIAQENYTLSPSSCNNKYLDLYLHLYFFFRTIHFPPPRATTNTPIYIYFFFFRTIPFPPPRATTNISIYISICIFFF